MTTEERIKAEARTLRLVGAAVVVASKAKIKRRLTGRVVYEIDPEDLLRLRGAAREAGFVL